MKNVRGRLGLTICLCSGAALPLAFAPFDIWILAPLCLAGLFFALDGVRPRRAFVLALLFGSCSFLGGTYWTFISVHGFGGAPLPVALLAMLGLVLVLALFFAVAAALAARCLPISGRFGRLLVLPAVWVVAEWCRGWMLTGFGWLSVGYSQSDTWLMSLAPVLGLHGISLAVALSAGALLCLLEPRFRGLRTALVTLALVWGSAWVLDGRRWTQPRPELLNVAVAAAAIPQDRKWLPEQYAPTLELYRELSLSVSGRDLIVWPEAAIPNLFDSARRYLEVVQRELAAEGTTLVTGIMLIDDARSVQNGVVAMTSPPQFYAKRHLVPFGEYFPVPDFARDWLRLLDLPYSDLGTGHAEQPPIRVAGETIAVLICYEDVFGAEILAAFPEATVIVNVSNDAWFGGSIAADQHLQIARMRSAEVGRYTIRSANTGVSAIINPLGDVTHAASRSEPAVLSATLQGFTGATPYVRFGNVPVLAVTVAMLAAAAVTARRRD